LLNNGSSVSSFNEVKNFCKPHRQVTILDADNNLGVSVGRNYLIEHTTEDWLFFVDNDITVSTKNWLEIFLNTICESTDIDAFLPNLFNVHLNEYQTHPSISTHGVNAFFDKNSADIKNIFPGGASIISREVFSKWGLYDDKMFVGFEDFEFALRAILAGKPLKVKCIQGIELIHSHLFAKNNKEKEAIRTRYHLESLEKSYSRIVEKHGVYLPDNWRQWTQMQIEATTQRQLLKKINKKVMCFVYGIRDFFTRTA
jgi:GT2 family glycosyltransferase